MPDSNRRQHGALGIGLAAVLIGGLFAWKFLDLEDADTWIALFTGGLMVATTGLWVFTAKLWRATQTAVEDSAKSIAVATESAAAMREVAEHMATSAKASVVGVASMRERTAQQMRAYLTIEAGSATYQEREKELRFEARPVLVNSGHTPAYNVSYVAKAAIIELPLDERFTAPLDGVPVLGATIGPHQPMIMNAIVDNYVDDGLVSDIKNLIGRGLCIWGIVRYRDAFKKVRKMKFCLLYSWPGEDKLMATYPAGLNESD